jgi:hypothetical protein
MVQNNIYGDLKTKTQTNPRGTSDVDTGSK